MLNAMTSGPAVYSRADTYTMARYLRISQEDDARDESNSITNQREIIRDYIASRNEFGGARLVEYKDDGLTGALTDRADYQRLFRDVERGDVNCIIVKDLSRIGRDMLEVDDMLMNRLVTLGIRFIAIGDGYDSFLHPLSNLELAVINLANQHYIRDLAQKSLSVKLMKLRRGEHLSMAPFGYVKSKTEKNKLAIDDEAAGYVRLIFSLAAEGNNFTRTAYLLNAQGIPTPAAYKRERGIRCSWRQENPGDEFWTSGSVGMILNSLTYTGTSAGYRSATVIRGTKHTHSRPKDEWIIVPDAHPAIVSQAEYDRAHEAINQKRRADAPVDHIFWSKLKCPVCGRTMKRINPRNPAFKCYTRYYTDRYDCLNFTIPQAKLEAAVLSSVKALAAVLTDKEELRLAALTQIKETRADIENRIRSEENAVRVLEESITKHFTAFVSGKLSKDAFLSKKEAVNAAVARKKAELERLRDRHYTVTAGKSTIEERLSELRPLLTLDKLNRELVDILIDKIFVRDENDIEIVWADGYYSRV
ncbi:MAG: recombinase family protein [Clostridiales Family XIII bacterium]|jgi:DNA invertase Pin-like site-specific DNA recombinase|nr:recombinase family protein [Clostridiales Family XIII bacterium]